MGKFKKNLLNDESLEMNVAISRKKLIETHRSTQFSEAQETETKKKPDISLCEIRVLFQLCSYIFYSFIGLH